MRMARTRNSSLTEPWLDVYKRQDNLSKLVPEVVHQPEGTWEVNNNFPKLASSAAHLFGLSLIHI